MSDERRKHGWPFWFAVIVLLPVLYVAGFGPACWLTSRTGNGRFVDVAYQPLARFAVYDDSGGPRSILRSYARALAAANWDFAIFRATDRAEWTELLLLAPVMPPESQ